jgi:nicotinamidase-related amidase
MRMLLMAMLALVLIVIVLAATRPGTVAPMVTAATPRTTPSAAVAPVVTAAQHESTRVFIERDWHPTGDRIEFRWISDDPFHHVGGRCYARNTGGSTRTADGQAGIEQVGEKFCIAAGAKDTPFDVPDERP